MAKQQFNDRGQRPHIEEDEELLADALETADEYFDPTRDFPIPLEETADEFDNEDIF